MRYAQLVIGTALGSLSVVLFLVPANVVPQGVTGASTLLNAVVGVPIGLTVFLLNLPILYLGYRMLPGGWRATADTLLVVVMFSLAVDIFAPMVPPMGVSEDRFLNAVLGGILGGVGGGIIYRTGTHSGGTSTLALIVQRRLGLPLSQTFLYTDTLVIVVSGLVFDVEGALYAMVALVLGGIASDYMMEGPSVIRTAFVVTDYPETVSNAVIQKLQRGVTAISARGMYTYKDRALLYITISRVQVNDLRQVVGEADPNAFVVIGQGHTAYGEGFKPIKRKHSVPSPAATPSQTPPTETPFHSKQHLPAPNSTTQTVTVTPAHPAEPYPRC